MSQKIKKLEQFFWLYLIINPVLDIVSGLYIQFVTKGDVYSSESIAPITPSLVIRMFVLLVMVSYILIIKDWKTVKIVIPMGIAWALSIVSEFITFKSVSIFIDIQYFAKFIYNIAVFFVYCHIMDRSKLSKEEVIEKIHKYIMFSLFLLTVVIVIPYIFGAGHYTYADRYGYRGFRGFYYSGNDITGALMILFPIGSSYYLSMKNRNIFEKYNIFCALTLAMTLLSMIMVGTKTAFIAIFVTIFFIVLYTVIEFFKNNKKILIKVAFVTVVFLLLYSFISLCATIVNGTGMGKTLTDTLKAFEYAKNESTEALLFNGRMNKLIPTFRDFRDGGLLTWIFGVGRGSQVETIEMDLCETLFYYGAFGFVTMLWVYFKEGVLFIIRFVKNFDILGLGAFVSLGLCVGYLVIAGHVLFTVTSGFYFAVILSYAKYITKK